MAGYKYDWTDVALYVYIELQGNMSQRHYGHIIVDEGQDFSPMMIKSLLTAVGEGGSFTFFGDVAQQIYGSRLSWRDSGINAERVWMFDANYRNPYTIVAFANDIVQSKHWQKSKDEVTSVFRIAGGPKPVLVEFGNIKQETNWVVQRAIETAKNQSTVIICRNGNDINLFKTELKNKGCKVSIINRWTPSYANVKTVYLATFHATKGLEFYNVFVPLLTDDRLPERGTLENADEMKLLYVVATRSKYGLFMSYHGTLTPLFPKGSKNYVSQKL
jgi:superfamily I DNA/RNA helicase